MDPNQQPSAVAPVLYTADGQPYYAAQPTTAPLVPYQAQPAPVVIRQPAPAYLPSQPVTVHTGRDPWPARLAAGGIGIGAAGVGLGFLAQALAAATTGLALLVGILALVWLLKSGHASGTKGAVNVNVTTHNHNRNR